MFVRLLLLFVIVPLVELALLLRLASWTSPLFTFGLVILTGIVGASLARRQGLQAFRQIQHDLQSGHAPSSVLLDALMILIAGALLVTPGVLTDLFGFSLLVPACRRAYRAWIMRYFRNHADIRFESAWTTTQTSNDPNTVDGKATRIDLDE